MCLFKKKIMKPTNRRALLFAINDYPGSENDLNGCINDINDLEKKLNKDFPGFNIIKYKDSEVTVDRFISTLSNAISVLKPGVTVLCLMDCCFSGSITRFINSPEHPTKNRFIDLGLPPREVNNKILSQVNYDKNNWIVISASKEDETSADAYIQGRYNGAFSYFAIKTLVPGITYRQWFDKIRENLPSRNFSQTPTLEGPNNLLDKVVFTGDVLIIAYSGHGTYTYDPHNDELDGQDEAIYLSDGPLIDDDIHLILDKIPE
jgi:hypothetical protein